MDYFIIVIIECIKIDNTTDKSILRTSLSDTFQRIDLTKKRSFASHINNYIKLLCSVLLRDCSTTPNFDNSFQLQMVVFELYKSLRTVTETNYKESWWLFELANWVLSENTKLQKLNAFPCHFRTSHTVIANWNLSLIEQFIMTFALRNVMKYIDFVCQ